MFLSFVDVKRSLIFLAGTPPHISHGGTSLVTTAPAAIIAPAPIVKPPTIVEL